MDCKILCAAIVEGEGSKTNCSHPASKFCGRCRLVGYCSKECQTMHWESHKASCTARVAREDWRPAWDQENRVPTFVGGDRYVSFGPPESLIGTTPAIDVLQLQANEGAHYDKEVAVCFAAHLDIRNVVKTLNNLPQAFTKNCTFHVNDESIRMVTRAVILLILAIQAPSKAIVECMIHLWYSAFITIEHQHTIAAIVKPVIADTIAKIKSKLEEILFAKTVKGQNSSVRILLHKHKWFHILEALSSDLKLEISTQKYRDIMHHRVDNHDRSLFMKPPYQRVAIRRFRHNGILVPFGHSEYDHIVPNPTMFDSNGAWLQKDSANPLDGWWWEDIQNPSYPVILPANDVYGQLYVYLYQEIHKMMQNCTTRKVRFVITGEYTELFSILKILPVFDRIYVSNMMDIESLGVDRTLVALKSMLNVENSKSVIIALFANAIPMIQLEKRRQPPPKTVLDQVMRYLPLTTLPDKPNNPEIFRRFLAGDMFLPLDDRFAEYCSRYMVFPSAKKHGFKPRQLHTVVPQWPWKIQTDLTQNDDHERFWLHLGLTARGWERYVEWEVESTK